MCGVFCKNFCSVCVCVHLCSLSRCILSHVSLMDSLLLQLYGFVSFYTQLRLILFFYWPSPLLFNKLLITIFVAVIVAMSMTTTCTFYYHDIAVSTAMDLYCVHACSSGFLSAAHSYVHFLECSVPLYAHFVVMFLVNLILSFLNILFFRFLCSHVFMPALKYCLLCAQWYTRRKTILFNSDTLLSPFSDHRFYSSIYDSLHVHAVSLFEMHASQMEKRLKTSLSIKK